MDNIKFGKFIKELRQKSKMTQKELAEKLSLTDKAISKWERGLSFPDITMLKELAEIFNVSVLEILNGEYGQEEKVDVEKEIQKVIEKITKSKEKRDNRIRKTKKISGKISLITFIIASIIQIGYFVYVKRHGFEYISDLIIYIINEILITLGMLSVILLIKKSKMKNIITYIAFLILTIINVLFMMNNGFKTESIVSFSNNFSNELVLKKNKLTGEIIYYRDSKILFAKQKESFSYQANGKIKTQWLSNDICAVTYEDKNNQIREFVATYGDRGNGISYSYVTNSLNGDWQQKTQYGEQTKITVNSKGITIKGENKEDLFQYTDCKQFGTIAIVLYNKETPKYIITLDKNCKLDEETGLIKKDGTITLCEVSMQETIAKSLYCTNYKDNENLDNYNVVSVKENDYKIKNGILYISYDGKKVIEVPGDFSNAKSLYNDFNYQISKEKTIFFYIKNSKTYLVYSNDCGENWETTEIKNNSTIQSLEFINSNLGFMLEFEDVAMGIAYGKISKTIDGGKSWNDISYGIGEEGEKVFKTSSQIKFINESTGFITMPNTGGEKSEVYITTDGGKNFKLITISTIEKEIYDYYNLPYLKENKIYMKIGQGSDGDYNGGDYKEFYSEDNGISWKK